MKIGVVGLGLIGGSIFKALINKYDVVGVEPSPQPSPLERGRITDDYFELKTCDIVFVCTPMGITLEVLEKLDNILPETAIVTDVCSLKGFLTHKKYKFKFIPSHPMAGTEHSGWENSFPELFKGAKWVITPIDGKVLNEQEVLEGVIESTGAQVVITTPEEHDKAVALISHMPLIIAQALCENIKDNKLAQTLASSGFRDTTRLALSNTQMANDMVTLNKENIEVSLECLRDCIDLLLNSDYLEKSKNIKTFRENLYL